MASNSFLAGAPDEASCMRYEIYAIREERDGGGGERGTGGEAMAVDVDGEGDALLAAVARSHLVAAASSSTAKSHLWYRDSLLSSLRSRSEEEPPWLRRKTGAKKSGHVPTADAADASTPSSSSQLLFWGELDFGDAVDDEWAAAWMLLRATAESFKVDDEGSGEGNASSPSSSSSSSSFRLAARCWDDDGDFLLIEAADALPRWLSPVNSDNRCWLFRGRVHVIPRKWQSSSSKVGEQEQERQPTLAEALEVLARSSSPSASSSSVSSSDAGPRIHAALARRLGDP